MTARTHAADEEAKKKIDEEEADEDDEEFLEAYRRQRMSEIAQTYKKANNSKTSKMFGSVLQLTRETFLDAVDNEDALVTVVVLITGRSSPFTPSFEVSSFYDNTSSSSCFHSLDLSLLLHLLYSSSVFSHLSSFESFRNWPRAWAWNWNEKNQTSSIMTGDV